MTSIRVTHLFIDFHNIPEWITYLADQYKIKIINIKNNPNFELRHNGMSHASEVVDLVKGLNMKYREKACTIIYTDYSKAKGQSISNSINIVLEIFIQRLTK